MYYKLESEITQWNVAFVPEYAACTRTHTQTQLYQEASHSTGSWRRVRYRGKAAHLCCTSSTLLCFHKWSPFLKHKRISSVHTYTCTAISPVLQYLSSSMLLPQIRNRSIKKAGEQLECWGTDTDAIHSFWSTVSVSTRGRSVGGNKHHSQTGAAFNYKRWSP